MDMRDLASDELPFYLARREMLLLESRGNELITLQGSADLINQTTGALAQELDRIVYTWALRRDRNPETEVAKLYRFYDVGRLNGILYRPLRNLYGHLAWQLNREIGGTGSAKYPKGVARRELRRWLSGVAKHEIVALVRSFDDWKGRVNSEELETNRAYSFAILYTGQRARDIVNWLRAAASRRILLDAFSRIQPELYYFGGPCTPSCTLLQSSNPHTLADVREAEPALGCGCTWAVSLPKEMPKGTLW